jgi:hypothetical protein
MSTVPPRVKVLGRFLLGLFIAGQLVFLVVGNLGPFIWDGLSDKQKRSVLARPLVVVNKLAEAWVQLTGQGQGWRLFAPQVQTRALFISVETEIEAPPAPPRRLASYSEPDSPGWYLHLPGSGDRLFHVEKELSWPLVAWDPTKILKDPRVWLEEYLIPSIRKHWRSYRSYLAWRIRDHEGSPPRAVILSVHIFPLSSAGLRILPSEVITLPLVRWRPGWQVPEGFLPVEVYDEQAKMFRPVPAEEKKEASP